MKRFALILAALVLAGCDEPRDTRPAERVDRGMATPVTAYDMKDGVRCYLFGNGNGNAISCVRL